jgi:hypothetical protein
MPTKAELEAQLAELQAQLAEGKPSPKASRTKQPKAAQSPELPQLQAIAKQSVVEIEDATAFATAVRRLAQGTGGHGRLFLAVGEDGQVALAAATCECTDAELAKGEFEDGTPIKPAFIGAYVPGEYEPLRSKGTAAKRDRARERKARRSE